MSTFAKKRSKPTKVTLKVDIRRRAKGPSKASMPSRSPRTTNRVAVYEEQGQNNSMLSSSWVDRIRVSRTRRGVFRVVADKRGVGVEGGTDNRWEEIDAVKDVKTPAQLRDALVRCAESLAVELDWERVICKVVDLAWLSAAVMGKLQERELPTLPSLPKLRSQRALRPLGKVRLAVEWGYDLHEVEMSLEQWVRVLHGQSHDISEPYHYEGERFTANWSFDKNRLHEHELYVTYDGGGEGWMGDFDDILIVEGLTLHGVDLAKLCLEASIGPANRESKTPAAPTTPGSAPAAKQKT